MATHPCTACAKPHPRGCSHYAGFCSDCEDDDDGTLYESRPYFSPFVCLYCILDGEVDLLEEVKETWCWGGNYHEVCRPAVRIIEFGQKDARAKGTPYKWDAAKPILRTAAGGMPAENIECFRKLYTLGFESISH